MKFGFIHNDNSTLSRAFADYFDSLKFTANATGDIDRQITEFIENKIALSGVSALFIKVALSPNYLEFLGLRLALHIRFSNKFPEIQTLPIILVSEESYEQLDRMVTFPGFLSSSGLYLSNENIDQVRKFISLLEKGSLKSCESVQELARKINIEPPASYQSHHSIANEWSILRWSELLNVDSRVQPLMTIRENIQSLLFYKFLEVKYPTLEISLEQSFVMQGEGKILYIDDKWNKGWSTILDKFFSNTPQINFRTYPFTFKDKNESEIVAACETEIKKENPDIVLLDLRLSDLDFSLEVDAKELAGYKVLKVIKALNPGIQVIIFSASNKVWNLLETQNAKADGFVLKESPEFLIAGYDSKESLNSLSQQVSGCLSRVYLKEIWILVVQINKVCNKNLLSTKYFAKEIKSQTNAIKYKQLLTDELEAMFEILNTTNKNRFNIAMLMLYKCVEYMNEIFFIQEKRAVAAKLYDGSIIGFYDIKVKIWRKKDETIQIYDTGRKTTVPKKIPLDSLNSTLNKSINLAKKLTVANDNNLENLIELSECRNKYIHSDKNKRAQLRNITSNDILNWLGVITNLIKAW
ncbi:MAG TPA: hypothetical protein VL098_09765 [Flavipsychrobacter sp.]|nr:hypothetical protein [Flavipsychrobacter sp.]